MSSRKWEVDGCMMPCQHTGVYKADRLWAFLIPWPLLSCLDPRYTHPRLIIIVETERKPSTSLDFFSISPLHFHATVLLPPPSTFFPCYQHALTFFYFPLRYFPSSHHLCSENPTRQLPHANHRNPITQIPTANDKIITKCIHPAYSHTQICTCTRLATYHQLITSHPYTFRENGYIHI